MRFVVRIFLWDAFADVYQEVARRIPLEMLGELGTRRPKLGS